MSIPPKGESRFETFKQGLYSGFGWSFGVTLGFAAVSAVVVLVLNNLGGLPLIGGWLADIVDATTAQLSGRTPVSTRKVSPTATPVPSVTPTMSVDPTVTIQLTPTMGVLQL
jgi:hypothetical protein